MWKGMMKQMGRLGEIYEGFDEGIAEDVAAEVAVEV